MTRLNMPAPSCGNSVTLTGFEDSTDNVQVPVRPESKGDTEIVYIPAVESVNDRLNLVS